MAQEKLTPRSIRTKKGITLAGLAEAMHMTHQAAQKAERSAEEGRCTLETLQKLMIALDATCTITPKGVTFAEK